MNRIAEINKLSWNKGAARYSALVHADVFMRRLLSDPSRVFHPATWALINQFVPDMRGKRICVPSSGDNYAAFAFAMLGARVTSCDISENQLANARRVAAQFDWGKSIDFVCADTMTLCNIPSGAYDFAFTSNGVHVRIDDLAGMYHSISRVLKPGGAYIMYDIHPFQRPFGDNLKVVKPYDRTGPFEDGNEINFHWRVMDIMNAMIDAGLTIRRVEEMYCVKDYDWPFWIPLADLENGVTATREEVDRMYDWRQNPGMALPSWLSVAAIKPEIG